MNLMYNIMHPKQLFGKIKFSLYKKKFGKCGKNVMMNYGFSISNAQNIIVGNNVSFGYNVRLNTYNIHNNINKENKPLLCIGNNINFGNDSFISCINRIIIDDGCLFGDNVFITDNFHGNNSLLEKDIAPVKRELYSKGEVLIGKNVWVGRNVCIMPNVKIGDYAIVGANAVVTHDVPSCTIVAGTPAKVIKTLK